MSREKCLALLAPFKCLQSGIALAGGKEQILDFDDEDLRCSVPRLHTSFLPGKGAEGRSKADLGLACASHLAPRGPPHRWHMQDARVCGREISAV